MSTEPFAGPTPPPTPPAAPRGVRWLPTWAQGPTALHRAALASVVVNVLIVVTGGAVRLTDSGLGCPTWPRCTTGSLTPTRAVAAHGTIEFTNRMLTFVVVAAVVATWVVAMVRRTERGLATLAALSIPAQAVLGGITVLTDLNPWLVAAHFLLSMAIIAVTFLLWWRVRPAAPATPATPAPVALLTWATVTVTAAVLAIGTVVTGSGPHAGDVKNARVHRTGLQVSSMAQLHADAVMAMVGLVVGLLALVYAVRTGRALQRAVATLLAVVLAQGVIGYAQYFLHVPPLLVGLHMFGACLVWLAALQVLFLVRGTGRDRAAVRTAG